LTREQSFLINELDWFMECDEQPTSQCMTQNCLKLPTWQIRNGGKMFYLTWNREKSKTLWDFLL